MATREVKLGNLTIGGGAPVAVQTMCDTKTQDVEKTLAQIRLVTGRGAELVRLAVPDRTAALALKAIVPPSPVPLVADIHFDYRLALLAIESGVAGLRINPGNIGDPKKIRLVAEAAGKAGVAIRVGVNAGSLDQAMVEKYGHGPEAMVQSALGEIALIEETGFTNLKVSLKASDVTQTVAAVRLFSKVSDLPQHLGVTEAGDVKAGAVRSAVGLGILLHEGLGDTIRVSLTGPPEEEVDCAWEILRSLDLRQRGPRFVSCPTCGRCQIDLPALLAEVKNLLGHLKTPLTVAVMGCEVNGPGEAKMADLGVAGGKARGRLFVKGRPAGSYPTNELARRLAELTLEMAYLDKDPTQ
ncbi:MAG: flavodoxin-dependent (E)-4-hydroxy-3-methylbut-2-enyl-diphosphate synthase [Deltaproteobacteria bacterium]|jgi:(E)-4-hydroxy-3-methylbut-2-enyl-diphosphate synthase|nr:flavodoxin-dependent (E)-4-hydroxy-3-methylbut-2-enyl-diphosphate synthase [Deltaproteobacteria bacterium]